jgi:hypothetical protein
MSEAAVWTAILTGVGALVGGVVGALVTGVIKLRNAAHKNTTAREKTVFTHWEQVADKLQEQVDHLRAHSRELMDVIAQQHEEHAECQVRLAEVYGWVVRYYDLSVRLCKAAGIDITEVPSLPPKPPRHDSAATEHRKRTIEHHSAILHAPAGPEATPKPPKGGGK